MTCQLWFGMAFMMVGIAFKFGAVPFHMWLPDVYQGARTPVTLYIASAPKLAALALLMRILVDGLRRPARSLAGHDHGAGRVVAAHRQCRCHCADQHQAHARLFGNRARRFHIARRIYRNGAGLLAAALFYTLTYVVMAAGARLAWSSC